MRNSASCGTPHHAELRIMRNSTCSFPQRIGSLCGKESQYSASMRNSTLDFRFLRSIGTNFLLHAELCSIGISAELRKMWKSNREFLASNIFHFLNLFHYIFRMMRKCCPNTPQEISASKLAENEGFCGNLRYGNFELTQALMHVLITCLYEKDPIRNSGENVMTSFYPL